jgi:S-DNA-T family DNA segregation ATPase FtsK/SpoIIIE
MASRAQPVLWRETVRAGAVRSGALFTATALFVMTALMALALASFDSRDAALDTAAGGPIRNLVGGPGAWFADLALMLFGPAVVLLLPAPAIVGLRLWRDLPAGPWVRMLRNAVLGVALMGVALAFVSSAAVFKLPGGWGGAVGLLVANGVHALLALTGDAWSSAGARRRSGWRRASPA